MKSKLLMLILGLILGAVAALTLPNLVRPFLPSILTGGGEMAEGVVDSKRWDGERLLLALRTEDGAVLVTFTQKAAEIDLLVDAGDRVTLGLEAYEPFVVDPDVAKVVKGEATPMLEQNEPVEDLPEVYDEEPVAGPEATEPVVEVEEAQAL